MLYMFETVLEFNGEVPHVKKLNSNGDENATPYEMNLKDKRCVCIEVDKDVSFHLSNSCIHCSYQTRHARLMLSCTSFMILITSAWI